MSIDDPNTTIDSLVLRGITYKGISDLDRKCKKGEFVIDGNGTARIFDGSDFIELGSALRVGKESKYDQNRTKRIRCAYCGCLAEKDYGTCAHCGAPL